MSTRTSRPVSASTSVSSPTSGSSSSRGSRISTARTCVALGDGRQERQPVARPAEVGHEDDRPPGGAPRATNRSAAAGDARRTGERLDVARVSAARGRAGEQRASSAAARPGRRGGSRCDRRAAERDDAEAVAALRGQVADRERHALGHVGLAAVGGAERHRRRAVEHEPRGERPLRDVDADVRDAASGRSRSSRSAGRRRPARTAGPGRARCRRRGRAPGSRPATSPRIRRADRQRRARAAAPRASGRGRAAPACGCGAPRRRPEPASASVMPTAPPSIWRGAGTAGRMRVEDRCRP